MPEKPVPQFLAPMQASEGAVPVSGYRPLRLRWTISKRCKRLTLPTLFGGALRRL